MAFVVAAMAVALALTLAMAMAVAALVIAQIAVKFKDAKIKLFKKKVEEENLQIEANERISKFKMKFSFRKRSQLAKSFLGFQENLLI